MVLHFPPNLAFLTHPSTEQDRFRFDDPSFVKTGADISCAVELVVDISSFSIFIPTPLNSREMMIVQEKRRSKTGVYHLLVQDSRITTFEGQRWVGVGVGVFQVPSDHTIPFINGVRRRRPTQPLISLEHQVNALTYIMRICHGRRRSWCNR